MDTGALIDILIGLMRRNGTITVPVYLWLGGAWVDLSTLTALQWATYLAARMAALESPEGFDTTAAPSRTARKIDGLTISAVQF